MWQRTGAEVLEMEARHHDRVLAATSHLPHMLAYCLVHLLGETEEHKSMFEFAAGGFRDFTRIASSDPRMWHDICLDNGAAIVQMLTAYEAELASAKAAIERGDGTALWALFERAKLLRDRYTEESAK